MSHVKNIAIVGAGGQIGSIIATALLFQGKHNLTAITRPDSKSTMLEGIHAIEKADYDSHSSLVAAMKGQDALIITMAALAPKEKQTKLIDAAVEAGVKWIVPNEYSSDLDNEQQSRDRMLGAGQLEVRRHIEKAGDGKTKWIAISCFFWYEFSLAGTEARYGFDFASKKLTLFDDGEQKITTTTWPQVGRAVAALFALPVSPLGGSTTASLSQFANRAVYISSFQISQRDMLASVLRVTGDRESDWTITKEDAKSRYARGVKMFREGNLMGFGILLYTRAFYPEDPALLGSDKVNNAVLGLPEEDIDEATKVAVEMSKKSQ